MAYRVQWLPRAVRDLDELDRVVRQRALRRAIALESDPRPRGCVKLGGENVNRIRIGDYRLLYRIDDTNRTVLVVRIRHRRNVYRKRSALGPN